MSETRIAQELGVSRQTVVRDVFFLKQLSQSWLDGLAKGGFVFQFKLALEKIKEHGILLEKLLKKTNDTIKQVVIIKEMDRNTKLYIEMLGEAPTIEAFKKAVNTENSDV
jgi:hypothetical protein